MAAIPKLNEANLEALSDILGATNTGLTGSEIGRYDPTSNYSNERCHDEE
jgi:hypothetical protein